MWSEPRRMQWWRLASGAGFQWIAWERAAASLAVGEELVDQRRRPRDPAPSSRPHAATCPTARASSQVWNSVPTHPLYFASHSRAVSGV